MDELGKTGAEKDKCHSDHHVPNQYPCPNRRIKVSDSGTYISLPKNVIESPERLATNNLATMAAKRAFTLPPRDTQYALLKSYAQNVHPDIPLLDLGDLLDAAVLRYHGRQTSLLLLQAVMFAGAIFVDPVHLHLIGYASKAAAVRDLFGRAKILYENYCEVEEIYVVQSLLLFTLFQDDCQTGPSFWMGEAYRVATAIGLQCDARQIYPNGHSNRALQRRLWWCLYTRDRLLTLSTGHRMYIRDGCYNVAMLTLADFESCYATGEAGLALGLEPSLRAIRTKNALALIFIHKAELCLFIGRIFTLQYFLQSTSPTTMEYYPRPTPLAFADFHGLEYILNAWQLSLAPFLKLPLPMPSPASDTNRIIYIQRAMLHMMYLTVVNALHRPWSSSAQHTDEPWEGISRDLSAWKIESASRDIITIAYHLHANNLTDGLADTTGAFLLSAMVTHAVKVQHNILLAPETTIVLFLQGQQVIQALREKYEWARYAEAFLDSTARILQCS